MGVPVLQRALAASALPRVVSLLPCFDCKGRTGLKGSMCRERNAACVAERAIDVSLGGQQSMCKVKSRGS